MPFLDDSLLLRSKQNPDDIAIAGTEITYSFKQFNARVDHIAAGLQVLGLKRGDRLTILADNSADYLATHYACARTGVILHVLNVSLTPSEMAYAVNDAGSQALVVDSTHTGEGLHQLLVKSPLLKQVIALDEPCQDCHHTLEELLSTADTPLPVRRTVNDPVLLIYTSGTTGRPKGA
ncbi:MAG: class I adenylate-forming enzyme family protein, partial [Pseudomonadota bacterium]